MTLGTSFFKGNGLICRIKTEVASSFEIFVYNLDYTAQHFGKQILTYIILKTSNIALRI
jgi:hypothetical protein